MTVYIVLRFFPDDFELHGVFMSEQDALQYVQKFKFCRATELGFIEIDDDYSIEIMETELYE